MAYQDIDLDASRQTSTKPQPPAPVQLFGRPMDARLLKAGSYVCAACILLLASVIYAWSTRYTAVANQTHIMRLNRMSGISRVLVKQLPRAPAPAPAPAASTLPKDLQAAIDSLQRSHGAQAAQVLQNAMQCYRERIGGANP